MTLLGIETATAVCAAALVGERGTMAERRVVETHIHSEKLLTLVQEVCAEARIGLDRLDAVAVSIGPGSFTGLRIGLSAAKGLCYALRRPLIAVPTFDAIALHLLSREIAWQDITICIDARQGDFYVGRYCRRGTEAELLAPVAARPLSAVTWWSETHGVATDAPATVRALVPVSLPIRDVQDHCSAATIAAIGMKMLANGNTTPVDTAEPMYLKDFVVKARP
jgi:tRNA threonylcarbamoyladenosine biosynthesis protein TsaB